MSEVQISYLARQFMVQRLTGLPVDTLPATCFNSLMQDTAATYGVSPITLVTSGSSRNLWYGRMTIETLIQACGVSSDGGYPLAILSTADVDSMGRKNLAITPSEFAGEIVMSLDFYISYPSRLPPDGEATFFAIQDALVGAFNTADSYALMPSGLTYNNELKMQADTMMFGTNRWTQCIPCAFLFRRVG